MRTMNHEQAAVREENMRVASDSTGQQDFIAQVLTTMLFS